MISMTADGDEAGARDRTKPMPSPANSEWTGFSAVDSSHLDCPVSAALCRCTFSIALIKIYCRYVASS